MVLHLQNESMLNYCVSTQKGRKPRRCANISQEIVQFKFIKFSVLWTTRPRIYEFELNLLTYICAPAWFPILLGTYTFISLEGPQDREFYEFELNYLLTFICAPAWFPTLLDTYTIHFTRRSTRPKIYEFELNYLLTYICAPAWFPILLGTYTFISLEGPQDREFYEFELNYLLTYICAPAWFPTLLGTYTIINNIGSGSL